jgi:signal transduction histidine kinase
VLALQDEERRRIARTLHEVAGQNLAVLSMNLSLLMKRESALSREDRALLSEASALSKKCSDDLRTTAYLLHPPLLDELGLAGAVRDYADGFAQRSGIRVDLELPPRMPPLPRDVEIALFRVMQECLTNIHRHSGSGTASISFSLLPGWIGLQVSDTGHGLLPASANAGSSRPLLGVGIAGMRERLTQLGGRLEIEAVPEKGTSVRAFLPLAGEVAS